MTPSATTTDRFLTKQGRSPQTFVLAGALRGTVAARTVTAAMLGFVAVSGCQRADRPPVPPLVSLFATADAVEEADNGTVQVALHLDSPTAAGVTVRLKFAGTATRGGDYSATFKILDGKAAIVDKAPPGDGGPELALLPFFFGVTEDAVVLVVSALNAPPDGQPAPLVAEWSTDIVFAADVHLFGTEEIPANDDPFDFFFGGVHEFVLPLERLEPKRGYFVRVYLGNVPPNPDAHEPAETVFVEGFSTNADGGVRTRCQAPSRTPGAVGRDPLFAEQWHLVNDAQTAFSNRPGTVGAELRMRGAIGAGVKLAVIDTWLEICHPDLAANAAAGGSFNFAHETTPGALSSDPFNYSVLGDHGTSVAGVGAAAANNGFGGRGVAPDVTLVGFDVVAAMAEDPDAALFCSLGGSDSNPDSAGVDIFNMSYGSELPGENASEDFVRLIKMGTTDLRSGRGALYVKAAGNEFEPCHRPHPINREIGCIASNADPDQNLPYLIAVGAFNADDVKSSYSSAGANLWVVGPGGEDGFERPAIITTNQAGVKT